MQLSATEVGVASIRISITAIMSVWVGRIGREALVDVEIVGLVPSKSGDRIAEPEWYSAGRSQSRLLC